MGCKPTQTLMTKSEKPERERAFKSRRRMLYLLLGLALCIIAFLIALYPMVMIGAPNEANIKIPEQATNEMVRDSLTKHFGEKYANAVMNLSALRGADYSQRHGAYTIYKGTNALGAMRKLSSGAQTPVRLTINGFRSLPLLIDKISAKMEFPADSLRAALADTALLAEYGLTPENALALFIEDTYEVYWTNSPREVLKKIGNHYKFVWGPGRTGNAEQLGLTPVQVMTIASIVDEESNIKDEKGAIGRLYLNRLQSGMRLQADPTVRFALQDYTLRRVTKAHLSTPSPYNTYMHDGLPPGPIRTSSTETIDEILQSKPHKYLYMCARPDFSGSHNFAATYEEHLENATRYQAALDARGIK